MNITEIPAGSTITLIASKGNKMAELKSVARSSFSGSLLITEITNSVGQPVSLAIDNLNVDVVYIDKNKLPVIWTSTKVKHIAIENEQYHRVIQSSPGVETDRRIGKRVFVGEDAEVKIGLSQRGFNVRIKDISYAGLSFIAEENVNFEGSLLHVIFKNGQTGIMNVATSVFRKSQIPGKSFYVYGCMNSDPESNPDIEKYIKSHKGY